MLVASMAVGCVYNAPVSVVNVDYTVYVAAQDSNLYKHSYRFSEYQVGGEFIQSFPSYATPTQTVMYAPPPKATAVCNDGSYSMAWINEACLNNGGVKMPIHHFVK